MTLPKPPGATRSSNCADYAQLVEQYDWDAATALAVMRAESGCRPDAQNVNINGSTDLGLMQVNSIHVDSGLIRDQERLDPDANLRAAYAIYRGQLQRTGDGWEAWSAYVNSAYKQYQ